MRSGKKLTVVILPTFLVLMSLLIVACGGTGGTGGGTPTASGGVAAPKDKQVAKFPIGATDFNSLDPAQVQIATDAEAIQDIFTGLVQFNDQLQVVDQLAASHSISSDGLTYTFTLKPNLVFSDGTALTSQDVIYSIDRALQPATASPVAYYLNLLKDYAKITATKPTVTTLINDALFAPDANTVKIVISKPAAYFLQALTYPVSYVVEKKIVDQYGKTWTDHLDLGGGDGPFKVQSYSHTVGLTLVPNPSYYGKQPQLQMVKYLISGNSSTTYNAYLAGQYDQAAIPSAQLAQAKTRSDYHEAGILVIRYISMNYLVPPFNNIKIRQAFALAVDKSQLVTNVLKSAVTASNHIVPNGMPGYNTTLKGPGGVTDTVAHADLAKQLLQQGMQELGITTLPTITFNYYTDSTTIVQAAAALVQMWSTNLGVTVKSVGTTFNKLVDLETANVNNAHGIQMWIGGWLADYPDPQDWLTTFFDKGANYNEMNYGQNSSTDAAQQQATQQLLEQADVNQNSTERLQQYNTAEQQIINDVGWLPLYQSQVHLLQNPKLQGVPLNALNITAPDTWSSIFIAQ